MNKQIIIIVAIIVLLLLGGGTYVMMKGSASPESAIDPGGPLGGTSASTDPASSSGQKSLKDLLLAGTAQKCTYTDKLDSVDMTGTTYIADGKMRNDYSTNTSGAAMVGHMIVEGTTSYMWNDGQKTGFKMKFDSIQTTPGAAGDSQPQTVDPNKIIDYNCSPWNADNSLFIPPSDITFTDYSSMMVPPKGSAVTPGTSNSANPVACAACNSLSGDEKAQCLSVLKCN